MYIPLKENKIGVVAEVIIKAVQKSARPTISILMIIAMPGALSLQKVIQSLEYLEFINIKKLPNNVKKMISLASSGSLFYDLNQQASFMKFKEDKNVLLEQSFTDQSQSTQKSGSRLLSDEIYC